MFESAELGHKISKAAYKAAVPELRTGLLQAQAELYENKPFPVLLLISGQDGAGKGEAINLLYEWMDSRFLSTLAFSEPTDEERERPPMWRYWRSLPPKGRLGIFAGSWYSDPIRQRIAGEITLPELDARAAQINRFEAMLAQEGALILKFWFHLTKDAQRERLKALESDPRTAWRVSRWNWDRLKTYDQLQDAAGHLLRITNTAQAPWIVLEGNDDRYRSLSVGQLVLHPGFRQRALVCAFEGPDAAGKGGAIRRIGAALDARQYQVIPVAAPSEEERAQPYLWRFWRHLPRQGNISIFDRTWYGRVLVERIEGFCSEADWQRAYSEINDFEHEVADAGTIVVKFWLQISQEEQLRRFQEREAIDFKRFKITEEDWRNREKWDAYQQAICDMVERTSTGNAPWTLVEANDKNHARVKVLRTLCERLEAELETAKAVKAKARKTAATPLAAARKKPKKA